MKHIWPIGRRTARVGAAVAASLLLLTGAAWRLSASAPVAPAPHAAVATSPAPIARAVAGARDSYADIVKVVAPSVVEIHVEGKATAAPAQFQFPNDDFFRRFFGNPGDQFNGPVQPRTYRQRALGSGVIVSSDGYILTNNHVVDGADTVRVKLTDGRTLPATIVGTDKPSDLALVKVSATGLPAIAIGNSDAVQVGDVVLAIGDPLGVGETVTMGIISAKGRSTGTGSGSYEDFLQTDAPINHGNSGGALVDMHGELIGINSQILSNSDGNIGIGFSIPSNMAKNVMEQLRTSGKVTRSQLGVVVQPVTSDMAESLGLKEVSGAIISSVNVGSAADHAGLKRGDVIESFDGRSVHDTNTLRNEVAETKPGSTVNLAIVRDGAERHVNVTLMAVSGSARPANGGGADSDGKASLGVQVAPLTQEMISRLRLPETAHGVVIEQVDPNGRAADAGLQPGDVI
jgi:serine protease Do